MNKPIVLPVEITVKIWNYFLTNVECVPEHDPPYSVKIAFSNHKERFRSWLWSQGGSLRVINKKFHIVAYDYDATILMLRWA